MTGDDGEKMGTSEQISPKPEQDRPIFRKRLVRYDTKPTEFGGPDTVSEVPQSKRISKKTGQVIEDIDLKNADLDLKKAEFELKKAEMEQECREIELRAKAHSFQEMYWETLDEVEGRVDPQEKFISEETVIETYTAEGLLEKRAISEREALEKSIYDGICQPHPYKPGRG